MDDTDKGDVNKGGAPAGNANAMRHGLKAAKLPAGCKYIEHAINALRRQLEAAVVSLRREVTLLDAAAIQTACKWEKHGRLAEHWLRHEHEKLTPTERLNFSREAARAAAERDKALASLRLDGKPDDAFDDLYGDKPASNQHPQR